MAIQTKQSSRATEYADTISDIYDTVQQAGSTRAEMQAALSTIDDLCTDAIPALDASDSEDADDADEDE